MKYVRRAPLCRETHSQYEAFGRFVKRAAFWAIVTLALQPLYPVVSATPFKQQADVNAKTGGSEATGRATSSADAKLREIVGFLRVAWDKDFEIRYTRFLLGSDPTVLLIPRSEMMKIVAEPKDGIRRDGATTQGLTVGDLPFARIFVVYDDVPSFLVAQSINHEIGHFELRGKNLTRNREEAWVRKNIDIGFLENYFGHEWIKNTTRQILSRVNPLTVAGKTYQGHTPGAAETLYQQFSSGGVVIERTELTRQILEMLTVILANTEADLESALDDETRR